MNIIFLHSPLIFLFICLAFIELHRGLRSRPMFFVYYIYLNFFLFIRFRLCQSELEDVGVGLHERKEEILTVEHEGGIAGR